MDIVIVGAGGHGKVVLDILRAADQHRIVGFLDANTSLADTQIDGVKTSIHQTDYLLRGLVIPTGKHQVEMVYRAPAARKGAII